MTKFLSLLTSGNSTLDFTVWTIYVGVMIGVLFSIINRITSHRIISSLIKNQCNDRDSSKTLAELKLDKNLLIRSMVKPSSPLMRYIKISNSDEATAVSSSKIKKFWNRLATGEKNPTVYFVDKASMYLPEDRRIGAELRFSKEKAPVFTFILAAVLLFAAACLALYVIPQVITAYSNIS